MITMPRYIIVTLAAVFSGYHLLLALYSLIIAKDIAPYIVAMALYAVATVVSLWPDSRFRMPLGMAFGNLAVCVAIPLLVAPQLDVHGSVGSDYSTWYPAAIGTLMVITAIRKRYVVAWVGVAVLAVHTVLWAGPGGLIILGVVGSIMWVAVAHVISYSLNKIAKDASRYTAAEREAAQWQAAQNAHVDERQFRLAQTNRMALPMLRRIVDSGGELTADERRECSYLEAAIRDEIRGRLLLNDGVRTAVMNARRRGTVVSLLDEGGLDETPPDQVERVLGVLAEAIGASRADRVIARTSPDGSDVAVTVVALSSRDESDAERTGGGTDDQDEDRVEVWLEIPRQAAEEVAE